MTLTDYLLARIAEDEEMWTMARDGGMVIAVNGQSAIPPQSWVERQLAECEAKRLVIEGHRGRRERGEEDTWHLCYDSMTYEDDCYTLLALGMAYTDRPDFLPEWREWQAPYFHAER